jgi:DNA-binding MarR family transcriptional regulator
VRRLADEEDRRARLIELTAEGTATADRYIGNVLSWLDDAIAGWSAQDRTTFYRLLRRFADDLALHASDGADGLDRTAMTDQAQTA